jgi:signal peptidase
VSALVHPIRFVVWAACGAVVAVALAIAVPVVLGYKSFTDMSGSMEPAIHTGDVVVTRTIHPVEARAGDIVTFRDPADGHRLITHRLRSIQVSAGKVNAVTKGDANNAVERWAVPQGARIGRVVLRLPRVGYVLAVARGPFGKLLLIVVPALLLGALELVRIWRPRAKEVSPDAAAA